MMFSSDLSLGYNTKYIDVFLEMGLHYRVQLLIIIFAVCAIWLEISKKKKISIGIELCLYFFCESSAISKTCTVAHANPMQLPFFESKLIRERTMLCLEYFIVV